MADSIKVRISLGAVLVAALSALIYADHVSGQGYGALGLTLLAVGAGLLEYARMTGTLAPVPGKSLALTGVLYVAAKGLGYTLDPRFHWLAAPIAIAGLFALFFSCLRGAPSEERFRGLAFTVFGFVYIPLLGGFAIDTRFAPTVIAGMPDVGEAAFFFTIALAKGSDIFAYFAGKLTGKTKFVPSVSPGKTVAGFVGAVVGGAVITCAFSHFSALGQLLPLHLAVGAGMVLALVPVSGDLIESFIKRSVAVKDSSALLPSFGGVLDIIDSIMIMAPPVYFFLLFLHVVQGGAL